MSCFFVTGTDTEVGKTAVTAGLLKALQNKGLTALGLKPIAAGANTVGGELQNEDALALRAASSFADVPYQQINPICFAEPIAPHIAAAKVQQPLSSAVVTRAISKCLRTDANVTLIEGAGGWLLPLNATETLADVVETEGWPVVLVIGLKLGCLNHALLTLSDLKRRNVKVVGWVGNQMQAEPMSEQQANLAYLKQAISAPCLGLVPYTHGADANLIATYLDVTNLSAC